MHVIADLDGTTYEKIKRLVERGEYRSVDQFLRVAADNQLALESSDTDYASSETMFDASDGDHPINFERQSDLINRQPLFKSYDWGYTTPEQIPTRLPFPEDRENLLLFSQYYRFLPLIFVLQKLATATTEKTGAVSLEAFHEQVASAVEPLRDALVSWETEHDVKRHERISTGFPKRDSDNPQRSRERFLKHYVGQFRHEKNEPAGFPHELGFVSIELDGEDPTIQLTPDAVALLQFANPILEQGPDEADRTLSEAEQSYIVTHIRENLGTEFDFMRFVYDTLVEEGPRYTDHLDRFESFLIEVETFSIDPSENRIRSHTAGTISRMVDLGILRRGRRRGHYEGVTPPTSFEGHIENHQTEIQDQ